MKKKISLKDIARHLGVSVALVSYVLNNKEKEGRVGKEMAVRIRKAAKQMDYQPNYIAQSLKNGKTRTIGLIVADISNPFFSNIARVVEDEASLHNYTVIFGSSDENAAKSQNLINALLNRQVDGFIIAPTERTEEQINALKKKGLPVVLIDRYFPDMDVNLVRINNFEASYKAVEHLFANGYRRISMIAYDTYLSHLTERRHGFISALKDKNIYVSNASMNLSSYKNIDHDIKRIMREVLDRENTRPDSFVFATNTLAVHGLKEIIKRNLIVPDDLGIISFDESDAHDFFYSPITHLNQNIKRIGKEAVKILMNQLNGVDRDPNQPIISHQVIINSHLVIRESCGEKKKK